VPAGHLVDSKGPDVPLRVGLGISLLAVPIILVSKEPHVMLLGSFIHGVGAAPIWPAVISSWTRGRSAKERGAIMGQILTGWMAGLGLGVILGNILVGLTGKVELFATFSPIVLWLITLFASAPLPWPWKSERLGYPSDHGMDPEEAEAGKQGFPPEL